VHFFYSKFIFSFVSFHATYSICLFHANSNFFLFSMQIFYLDNLDSRSAIYNFITPRAKFFSKSVMESIIRENKRRDKDVKLTYGNLLVFQLLFYSMFRSNSAHVIE
jgi:hypothetical protein